MSKGTMNIGTLNKGSLVKNGESTNGSGSIGNGAYNVKVIDYDGTVIAEGNLDEGKTFRLPSAPKHEGLIFQEWSSTQEIVNGKITIGKNDVIIGAIYTTASGQNEFIIEVTTVTGLSVTLNINGTKDWGDGTSDTLTTHTYSDYGEYTIKCDGTTITSSSSSGLFGQTSSSINYYCKEARIVTVESITDYTFQYCYSVEIIMLSNTVKTLGVNSVRNCHSLRIITFPNSITTISANAFQQSYALYVAINIPILSGRMFYNCYSLSYLGIKDGLSVIASESCSGIRATKIKMPKNVSEIQSSAFSTCQSIIEYDFSDSTSVPTLSNVNAFSNINAICKIKVPSALYDEWIAEANWVTYEDYIVAV